MKIGQRMPKTKISIPNHNDIFHSPIGLQKLLKNQEEILKLLKKINPNVAVVKKTTIKLTNREAEVAQLVLRGKTNKEIGKILFISPFTAKTHVNHILKKLQIKSRAGIAKHVNLK